MVEVGVGVVVEVDMTATTRIERIAYADGETVLKCEAADRAHCCGFGDLATYRIERISQASGEVWRRHLCLGAAAAWATRHGVPFPEISPADLMDYLNARAEAARMVGQ